ncbi:MAG: hypothetical protein AAFX50_15600, partial [Acidobacteriota bacterium]
MKTTDRPAAKIICCTSSTEPPPRRGLPNFTPSGKSICATSASSRRRVSFSSPSLSSRVIERVTCLLVRKMRSAPSMRSARVTEPTATTSPDSVGTRK